MYGSFWFKKCLMIGGDQVYPFRHLDVDVWVVGGKVALHVRWLQVQIQLARAKITIGHWSLIIYWPFLRNFSFINLSNLVLHSAHS